MSRRLLNPTIERVGIAFGLGAVLAACGGANPEQGRSTSAQPASPTASATTEAVLAQATQTAEALTSVPVPAQETITAVASATVSTEEAPPLAPGLKLTDEQRSQLADGGVDFDLLQLDKTASACSDKLNGSDVHVRNTANPKHYDLLGIIPDNSPLTIVNIPSVGQNREIEDSLKAQNKLETNINETFAEVVGISTDGRTIQGFTSLTVYNSIKHGGADGIGIHITTPNSNRTSGNNFGCLEVRGNYTTGRPNPDFR